MKIDLHVHTSEMSLCGRISSEDTIKAYVEAGYDGIVITNHYNRYTQDVLMSNGCTDYFTAYKNCINNAVVLGERYGLRVFPGCELKMDDTNNDYLVYGAPDEFLSRTEELWRMSAGDVKKEADKYGFLFYQAHPFRNSMQIIAPWDLHGIEIKNGSESTDSRNDIAVCWANRHNLKGIAGSDCHFFEGVGKAGIITDTDVEDIDMLVGILRKGEYAIF